MNDARRRRILQEAREHTAPEKLAAEREELARRAMALPLEDPVTKWREDGDERNAARREAKAEIAAAKAPDWSDIDARIRAALEQERKFIFEVVSNSLGQAIGEQHKADREALRHETDRLWAVCKEVQNTVNEFSKTHRADGQPGNDLIRRVN